MAGLLYAVLEYVKLGKCVHIKTCSDTLQSFIWMGRDQRLHVERSLIYF